MVLDIKLAINYEAVSPTFSLPIITNLIRYFLQTVTHPGGRNEVFLNRSIDEKPKFLTEFKASTNGVGVVYLQQKLIQRVMCSIWKPVTNKLCSGSLVDN